MVHASTLLVALRHLTGVQTVNPVYEVPGRPSASHDDLKPLWKLDRRTSGVETTAGPSGQGGPPVSGWPWRPYRHQAGLHHGRGSIHGPAKASSAPLKALQEIYGVTADRMVAAAQKRLS